MSTVESRAGAEEGLMVDPDSLDPKMHYRWVKNEQGRIAKRVSQGYRFVERKEVKLLVENEETPDGKVVNYDAVLMCCDLRRRKNREKEVAQRSKEWLKGPEADFKKKLRESGARKSRVFDDSSDEITLEEDDS